MKRLTSIFVAGGMAAGMLLLSMAGASAQQSPQYPLDDKLANVAAIRGRADVLGNLAADGVRWGTLQAHIARALEGMLENAFNAVYELNLVKRPLYSAGLDNPQGRRNKDGRTGTS